MMNLFSIIQDSAGKWPEDTAVVHDGRSYRYADLHEAAESLAFKLTQVGIQRGGKVGIMCPSSAEYLISLFAVLRTGGIVVPISPALKSPEIKELAEEMALDGFCYSAHFRSLMPEEDEKTFELPIFRGKTSLCVRLASTRATPQSERDQLQKLDAACIGYSSGTTSKAKGIMLSHATILARIKTRSQTPPITKASRVLWLRPMDRPMPYQICECLQAGAMTILANAFALEPLPRLIKEHRIDQIYASPLFYRMLNEQSLAKEDLRSVKYFISGGSSLPNRVAEVFREKFDREIVQSYGLAECAPVFVNVNEDMSKRGSVGKPVPGREVKLAPLSSDSSGDEAGELLVRGPGLFEGYYRPWRLREEVLENGWLRTGDVARRDADGYYWIVGRAKDVINVGGVKVFPYELEAVLLNHPAVEETVVFGMPEARFGEVAHARVKLKGRVECTEKELLRYANERLSVFKALRSVEFVDEIPRTVTGKPRRIG